MKTAVDCLKTLAQYKLGDHWYGTWIILGSLFFYFTLLDFGLFSASERFVTYALTTEDTQEANGILSTCLLDYEH